MNETCPFLSASVIPVLSLIVTALAVFFGPIISLKIAKQQIRTSLVASHWQVIAPMRQAWINNLREILSDLFSGVLLYYRSLLDKKTDPEALHYLIKLEYRIKLQTS